MHGTEIATAERHPPTAPTKIDTRRLPFGLTRYRKGVFQRYHGLGSGIITASQVPGLFGQSRFHGRYAIAAHVAGKAPLEFHDNSRTKAGRYLEPIAAKMLAEETGLRVKAIRAWAPHRTIQGFIASPDTVAWRDTGEAGNCELKLVEQTIFERDWLDGPPLEVQLQHQAQFAATGATWGYIGALVWGMSRFELIAYLTEPNRAAIGLIEDQVSSVLDLIARGELPAPDPHPTSIRALQTIYPGVIPEKSVQLQGAEAIEFKKLFDEWGAVKAAESAAKKRAGQIKNMFAMVAVDADEVRIDDRRSVRIKEVERSGFTVAPTKYRDYRLKDRTKSAEPQQVKESAEPQQVKEAA